MQNFDFGDMMSQVKETQEQMGKIQEKLKDRVVEGTAGGGMVKVQINGQKEVLAVKIDPEIVDSEDVELLEDMIIAATNQGMEKAEEMVQEEMGKVSQDLGLPNMEGLMDMFT